ncbi:DNA polymerase III subunit beta [Candidatus Microgenomates bacterium]|nr:MAG: DNA polymerase III subunit beta [Candidatus Microgenomates bacterium]
MKCIVLQEQLKKAISVVSKGISTKTQLPILSNMLLEAKKGQLTLSSTNLETSTTYWIGAQVESEGELTVPARFLHELVSTFNFEKVTLETNQSQLKLMCGESEATLAGIEASEFPPLPKFTGKQKISLAKELFLKQLPFVLLSASSDEGRPILTGVKFMQQENELLVVATDGFRLSVKKLSQKLEIPDGFVVPAKVLAEVGHLVHDENVASVSVELSLDTNQILFELDSARIATRLIDGEYPPFQKIIPQSYITKMVIDTKELARAVKFAAVFAKESANLIKMKIGGDSLVISANMPQIGENKTTVKANIEGEGGEIAFNARFLIDFLNTYNEDSLQFEMTGPLAPGVFKSPQDVSYFHIIMPVRVQG